MLTMFAFFGIVSSAHYSLPQLDQAALSGKPGSVDNERKGAVMTESTMTPGQQKRLVSLFETQLVKAELSFDEAQRLLERRGLKYNAETFIYENRKPFVRLHEKQFTLCPNYDIPLEEMLAKWGAKHGIRAENFFNQMYSWKKPDNPRNWQAWIAQVDNEYFHLVRRELRRLGYVICDPWTLLELADKHPGDIRHSDDNFGLFCEPIMGEDRRYFPCLRLTLETYAKFVIDQRSEDFPARGRDEIRAQYFLVREI